MPEKKKKLPVYTTPAGIAGYPWLTKPDTKFNAAGEYRINLILDEAEAQPLREHLDKLLDAAHKQMQEENPKVKVKKAESRVKPFLDSEKNEVEGKVQIGFKMKAVIESKKTGEKWEQRPAIFDAAGKVMVNPKVGGGSTVKIAYEAAPYYSAKDKEAGITLRLKAVQILNLVEFGQKDAASYGFDVAEPSREDSDSSEQGTPDAEADF